MYLFLGGTLGKQVLEFNNLFLSLAKAQHFLRYAGLTVYKVMR